MQCTRAAHSAAAASHGGIFPHRARHYAAVRESIIAAVSTATCNMSWRWDGVKVRHRLWLRRRWLLLLLLPPLASSQTAEPSVLRLPEPPLSLCLLLHRHFLPLFSCSGRTPAATAAVCPADGHRPAISVRCRGTGTGRCYQLDVIPSPRVRAAKGLVCSCCLPELRLRHHVIMQQPHTTYMSVSCASWHMCGRHRATGSYRSVWAWIHVGVTCLGEPKEALLQLAGRQPVSACVLQAEKLVVVRWNFRRCSASPVATCGQAGLWNPQPAGRASARRGEAAGGGGAAPG